MKKTLLYFCFILLATGLQAQTDVFFSEYIEGSGNNKALEIYNPTDHTIDLSNYWVLRFSNGNLTFAEGGSTHLTGTIDSFKTFILVNGQTSSTPSSPACSPVLQAMANQLDGVYPAPTYMNGNDAMALVKTPGGVPPNVDMSNVTAVDLIGEIGLGAAITAETGWSYVKDSTLTYNNSQGVPVTGKVINYIVSKNATDGTTFGPFWMSWTSDHSLIRKPNVIKGVVVNPHPFVVTSEWDTVPAVVDTAGHLVYKDIWTNLGQHNCIVNSIGEASANSWMSVYPNPITANRFSVTSLYAVREVEILSNIGQSVYNQTFTKGQTVVEVGPFDLKAGVYLVRVVSFDNGISVKKILVQ